MIVVYDTLTGMGEIFAEKLGLDSFDINVYTPNETDKIILLTRNFNFGEITDEAEHFLNKYSHLVEGVAVNSDRSWGEHYGAAADKISEKYNIANTLKYEITGSDEDVATVLSWVK